MTTPKKTSAKAGTAKTAPKNRATAISQARKAAFNVLLAVERGHSHSDDLLRGKAVNALSLADRNLATALVLGVLRWQIQLDHQIQALLTRPNAKLDAEIRIALRLGAFQILRMNRIPARAAIDESVELAKQAGHRFASAMVNAVLHKLEPASPNGVKSDALKGHDFSRAVSGVIKARALTPEGNLSEDEQAHPVWMVERWVSFYGREAAQAICRHGQSQPAVTIRLASQAVEAELVETGVALEAGELLTVARTVVSGDVTEALRVGHVRLQDESSQLVAELASESSNQKVKSILDACAAPGGKTLILAERNPQAHIIAMESSPPRLEQLRKRLAYLGDRIECRHTDATTLTDDSVYDLALADVPCSGTGTLGRNPEIRHRLRPEDLARQAERQRAILSAALRTVRPGGRVVYSTCSLEPEENEQVVAAVLAAAPNVRILSLEASLSALHQKGILAENGAKILRNSLTSAGAFRLLPDAFHTDGFFICLLERVA
jgi:16S rRNA (cytosine967-C5)-methyltransferase